MNFLEAISYGEWVKRSHWMNAIKFENGMLSWKEPGELSHDLELFLFDYLADDWELVNPIPATEEVEVKRFGVIDSLGIMYPKVFHNELAALTGEYQNSIKNGTHNLIKLTGHYPRPVKKKVKKREEVKDILRLSQVISGDLPITYEGKKVKIFVEWEEDE